MPSRLCRGGAPRARAVLCCLFLLTATRVAHAQHGTVRGRVTSADTRATASVAISLVGTTQRTETDSAGRFVLAPVPAGRYDIRISPRGRDPMDRAVVVRADTVVDVVVDLDARPGQLATVVVSASRPLHVIGHLPDVADGVIYAGKKTEVIVMDSLHANLAQDVERQILGRIPGAHFSETQGAGFPSNGVAFRGLDPTQSVEVNTRQNGVSIAADLFGYPETYYTPPSEALDRIEVVRGAGSLAFGPQFGGVVNYVTRRGTPQTAPTVQSALTTGSFGLVNSFTSLSGGSGAWTYYGFFHARTVDGWRPNSDVKQTTGYASATYRASDRLSLGVELTTADNRIHMPGGLSDDAFARDPSQSFRARNWLASPWNIAALRASWAIATHARLEATLSYMWGDRHLIWRNEDGGAGAADAIDPLTGRYVPREVERETFANTVLETRLRVDQSPFGIRQTLAAGLRLGTGDMRRFAGGPGSTGSDFDMTLYGGTWARALRFKTTNAAAFVEDLIHVSGRLTVTPGFRLEYVSSSAAGYTDVTANFAPRTFVFPLLGVGAEYAVSQSTALYANVSEAYRPVLYASLTPYGSIARVDPGLRTARGYNTDLGWRGTAAGAFKFDVNVFYLSYRDRIGTRTVTDSGRSVSETSNIGTSVHTGMEAYIEVDPFALVAPGALTSIGAIDLFTSFAYVDARYVTGAFSGNRVEQAPGIVQRTGITWARGPIATTVQGSYTSGSFGDANNSVRSNAGDGAAGFVPAYTVVDWSLRARLPWRLVATAGVNNVLGAKYFTKRTDEYPGPGILPGIGRSVYLGVAARF